MAGTECTVTAPEALLPPPQRFTHTSDFSHKPDSPGTKKPFRKTRSVESDFSN